ncbi:MAG: hypothetical protein KDI16_10855 [Halioglobus sp.]|nr:hypothetical protein [Halioglobus sp.]
MKNALLIAYHFPPVRVSSGLQRTLAFVSDLRAHGWSADVLTAHPRAYETTSTDQLEDIPPGTTVSRAFALDTARHLAVGGRYAKCMALPDRWISWWPAAVISGLRMIRRSRPAVIWSTYPIATAHLIALTLHKLTGIPWVADFRDSMTEADYPVDPAQRKLYRWIEQRTVASCYRAVFTTPGAIDMYRARYSAIPHERWLLIPNGYNEAIFRGVESDLGAPHAARGAAGEAADRRITLLHSGVVYPSERDPQHFFEAVSALKRQGRLGAENLRIVMRATGHDAIYQPHLDRLDITDIVSLEPGLPYREALAEMLAADGLLILQGSSCNHQVPAKLYEYFRAGRPILALTDRRGDTAKTMHNAGLTTIAALDDRREIQSQLIQFLEQLRAGTGARVSPDIVSNYSRSAAAKMLAEAFEAI